MNHPDHLAHRNTVPGSAMSTAEIKARIDAMFADRTSADPGAAATPPRRARWASSRRGARN
ncbi:hypothetical protein [Rhodococcus rhodochrous]|uniref:AMP-binding protein n=1 Tax=Rhodococcus rhodochrous KG-21 TaxID=1441923 RepID=A0A0M8PJV8_RHORH|nr:hypothetical protein [Rhodococcus rhodochrous]KOS54182.1 AMP-binding protein [Rhodococcus rhodochrous KG-21]